MNTRAERLRRRGNRPPRLRGLSINRLLPNMLTMLALCAGVTAMRFAIQGRFEAAVFSVMIAAVFDALDGRIARLLNGQSRFGEELDSLSDVVSFGVAPAITLYLWVLAGAGTPGWLAVLTFSVCAALRLARFNSKLGDSDLPPYAYNYFTGVPAPAAAGLVLLPLVISFEAGPTVFGHPLFVGSWAVMIALLMVSQWPTFSFKGIRVPQKYVIPLLAAVGIIAAMLVSTPWLTLAMIGIAYLISLPFSFRQYRRLRHEAELLHAEAQGGIAREPDPASDDPIMP